MIRRCPDNWLYCSGYCAKHEGIVEEIKVFAAEEEKFYTPNNNEIEIAESRKPRVYVTLSCTNMDHVNRGLNLLGMLSRSCGVDKKLWKDHSKNNDNNNNNNKNNNKPTHSASIHPIKQRVTTFKPAMSMVKTKTKGKKKKKAVGPPLNVDRNKMKNIAEGIQQGDDDDEEEEDEDRDNNQYTERVSISSSILSQYTSRKVDVWQEYDEHYFMNEKQTDSWENDWESESDKDDFFEPIAQNETNKSYGSDDDDLQTALTISLIEEQHNNHKDQDKFYQFSPNSQQSESTPLVCPVGCGKVFSFRDSEMLLNKHIDECLNRVYIEENNV